MVLILMERMSTLFEISLELTILTFKYFHKGYFLLVLLFFMSVGGGLLWTLQSVQFGSFHIFS